MNDQLKYRIMNLSDDELKLVYFKFREAVDSKEVDVGKEGAERLVAYVQPKSNFNSDLLHAILSEQLPEYMIPAQIKLIKELPKLPNGKIDINALQIKTNIEPEQKPDLQRPKNEIEEQLVLIWEEILNFSPISTADNFFEIGGDSILSIQIIAKARKKGILLSPNQLFEHQNIAELALFAQEDAKEWVKENSNGEILMTPIQHWFFEQHKIAPHFWNQIIQITNIKEITFTNLKKVVQALVFNHDALRSSFYKQNEEWIANIIEPEEIDCCHQFDLSDIKGIQNQNNKIDQVISQNQANSTLNKGNLFRAVYFECGDEQGNKIILIAHHLVVDKVSWNIILDDFKTGLDQVNKNQVIDYLHKTASIKLWGNHLEELSKSNEIGNECDYWNAQSHKGSLLPKDFVNNQESFAEHSFKMHQCYLNENDTAVLLKQANLAFNTKTEDLLLSSLVKTFCEWANLEQFHFALEKHGRTADIAALDVSNTVGWFTSFFPINLVNSKSNDMESLVKSIKEQLRAIPNEGIGHGLLKYFVKSWNNSDLFAQAPELIFNYLGRSSNSTEAENIRFETKTEGTRHPLSEHTSGLEINLIIEGDRLCMRWSYCTELYKESTIVLLTNNFIQNLKNILSACINQESAGYTPSDFPEAGISQSDLDSLMSNN
jgi:non-ribosomal peptide synthase protein (TIGR01720 family)